MTTAAAGNMAGHPDKDKDKEKEKPGMRRALGRGLASLLPGPRVVPPPAPPVPTAASASAPSVQSPVVVPAAGQQIPPSSLTLGRRNDKVESATAQGDVAEADRTRAAGPAVSIQGASASHTTPSHVVAPQPAVEEERIDIYAVDTPYPDPREHAAARAQEFSAAPQQHETIDINAAAEVRIPGNIVTNLAITDIDRNPFQTRHVQDNDALEELANSIKAQGVVQPILVRPSEEEDGRYVLILGERRLHASKKAGKTHIPAIVRRVSQQQAAEMTIIENLQREDLSPLEQAEAFRVLSTEFNMTQQEIGERVGLSRASIANYMRLLKLPHSVMDMLATKVINFAQAKEFLKLEDNDRIAEAAIYAVKKGMSIEQIEMLVLRMEGLLDPLPDMPGVKKKDKPSGGARWVDPNVRAAQMDLERTLGLRVRIRDRKGKGRIVIEYATVDDYERVVEMLRKK